MLYQPLIALLVILCLVFPLGIAMFAFGWALRSYRSRYELENALAENRLLQGRVQDCTSTTTEPTAEQSVKKPSEGIVKNPGKKKPTRATPKTAKKVASTKTGKKPGDDLTRISGVGPVIRRRLETAGIDSFAQIAAWKKADIDAFSKLIASPGRILSDDWIGQAKKLAGKRP